MLCFGLVPIGTEELTKLASRLFHVCVHHFIFADILTLQYEPAEQYTASELGKLKLFNFS